MGVKYTEWKKRYRRKLFEKQDGLCWWCKEPMQLIENMRGGRHPPRMATLEHLDDRFSPNRGRFPAGERRIVLACAKCNWEKGVESQAAQPIEELHRRASLHKGRKNSL